MNEFHLVDPYGLNSRIERLRASLEERGENQITLFAKEALSNLESLLGSQNLSDAQVNELGGLLTRMNHPVRDEKELQRLAEKVQDFVNASSLTTISSFVFLTETNSGGMVSRRGELKSRYGEVFLDSGNYLTDSATDFSIQGAPCHETTKKGFLLAIDAVVESVEKLPLSSLTDFLSNPPLSEPSGVIIWHRGKAHHLPNQFVVDISRKEHLKLDGRWVIGGSRVRLSPEAVYEAFFRAFDNDIHLSFDCCKLINQSVFARPTEIILRRYCNFPIGIHVPGALETRCHLSTSWKGYIRIQQSAIFGLVELETQETLRYMVSVREFLFSRQRAERKGGIVDTMSPFFKTLDEAKAFAQNKEKDWSEAVQPTQGSECTLF